MLINYPWDAGPRRSAFDLIYLIFMCMCLVHMCVYACLHVCGHMCGCMHVYALMPIVVHVIPHIIPPFHVDRLCQSSPELFQWG